MIGPPGVSIALEDGPLVENPTWTRIDDIDGILIENISIQRGRPDERSKVTPAEVTITGKDTKGVLDSTNPNSVLFPWLASAKQMAISLYRPDTAEWHWLVRGHNATYDYEFDVSKKWFEFEITFTDALAIIDDAEIVPDDAGNEVPSESVGDCYYTGQHCDDRLLAVVADTATAFSGQTWPAGLLEIATGNVFVQGRAYSSKTSMLSVIDEAVDAEYPFAANRYITKYGAFAFRGRFYRFNPEAYLAADDASRHSGARMVQWNIGDDAAAADDDTVVNVNGLKWGEDKDNLINACLVTPVGITTEQLASGSNFFSDDFSIEQFGVRTSGMSFENLIIAEAEDGNTFVEEAASYADSIVQNYKDPVTYVKTFTVKNPSPGASANQAAAKWAILTGIELSDMVFATTTHPGGGGFNPLGAAADQYHFVEQINYEITALQGDVWMTTMTVALSSRHHYRYLPASWGTSPHAPTPPGGLTAAFFRSPGSGAAPLTVNVTDTSTGGSVGWDWDWGDGSTHGTGPFDSHVYSAPGTYTITLTVQDLLSNTDTASHTVTVT